VWGRGMQELRGCRAWGRSMQEPRAAPIPSLLRPGSSAPGRQGSHRLLSVLRAQGSRWVSPFCRGCPSSSSAASCSSTFHSSEPLLGAWGSSNGPSRGAWARGRDAGAQGGCGELPAPWWGRDVEPQPGAEPALGPESSWMSVLVLIKTKSIFFFFLEKEALFWRALSLSKLPCLGCSRMTGRGKPTGSQG